MAHKVTSAFDPLFFSHCELGGWSEDEVRAVHLAVLAKWPGEVDRAVRVVLYGSASGLSAAQVLHDIELRKVA